MALAGRVVWQPAGYSFAPTACGGGGGTLPGGCVAAGVHAQHAPWLRLSGGASLPSMQHSIRAVCYLPLHRRDFSHYPVHGHTPMLRLDSIPGEGIFHPREKLIDGLVLCNPRGAAGVHNESTHESPHPPTHPTPTHPPTQPPTHKRAPSTALQRHAGMMPHKSPSAALASALTSALTLHALLHLMVAPASWEAMKLKAPHRDQHARSTKPSSGPRANLAERVPTAQVLT